MHIRIDDTVEVVAGDDRGTRGKVLRVDHAAGKVVVEGVARVHKHVRRSQRNPQGGRLSKEMPIQSSRQSPHVMTPRPRNCVVMPSDFGYAMQNSALARRCRQRLYS